MNGGEFAKAWCMRGCALGFDGGMVQWRCLMVLLERLNQL